MRMLDRLFEILIKRRDKLLGGPSGHLGRFSPVPDVEAMRRLGNESLETGDLVQAEHWFREGLRQAPADVKCMVSLGYVLKERGELSEARICFRKAINASDDASEQYEAYYLLGEISQAQSDWVDAAKNYAESLRLNPDFTQACRNLHDLYQLQGNVPAARELLLNCVKRRPECREYRLWLTEFCLRETDYEGVVEHLTKAVELGATAADTHMTLGAALCRLGRVPEADRHMSLAASIDPTLAVTRQYELGIYQIRAGDPRLATQHLEQAIALNPHYLAAHSALLMAMSYEEDRDEAAYRMAAQRFDAAVPRPPVGAPAGQPDMVARKPSDDPLRVGFVSGDLVEHPVAFFLQDVLQHLDRERVHLVAYSNNVINHEVTPALRAAFDEWHETRHLPDEKAANLIRSHRIDVLFDLGGHTGDNRLSLFAQRAAPVQVSWLGYWASTGLREMDYILADAVSVPEGSTEWFSETVIRLPQTRLCMSVPQTAHPIAVHPPPSLGGGPTTFGSFQQVAKMTPRVLKVWAAILRAAPQSRLRLQTRGIGMPSVKEKLCRDLTAAGIDLARVSLLGAVDRNGYLQAHNEVDLLLDTFPYPGGTTTALALWMGVPTVTMTGDTMIARQGVCMLQCMGLADWVAHDDANYVEIACRMASDRPRLAELRAGLRGKAEASALFNAERFAHEFQRALEQMAVARSA